MHGGIIVHIEYQSVCPFVGIGNPPPPERECVSPLDPKGEEHNSLACEEMGGPNSDDWAKSLTLCILCDSKPHNILPFSDTPVR
jgi:hypothetical protein